MKIYIIISLFFLLSCKNNSNQTQNVNTVKKHLITADTIRIEHPKKEVHIVKSVIDTVSINEIKHFIENKSLPIYSYYQKDIDDLDTWSRKIFGNSQGVDITYAECFIFKVTSNFENKKYPVSNLSDFHYKTAYVFKATDTVVIQLKIDKDHWYFKNNPKVHPDEILKVTDTVMYPIKLSLINGYVKNKTLFYKNGRVKQMEVLVNKKSKGIVVLLDTPLVQEFSINTLFKRDDIITLKPLTYYKGTAFDDICISEIQHSLGYTAHPSINKKATKYHITGN
jgi:hypothetical protein